MGLSVFEMYELRPRQWQNIVAGFREGQEAEIKERWYQTRWVSYWSAFGHLKKGTMPENIIKFPWEDPGDVDKAAKAAVMPTEAEIEESREFWRKHDERKANGQTSN